VTEVLRRDDNTHGATVTITTEFDKDVFAAIQAIDPALTSGFAPNDLQGWEFAEVESGRRYTLRREFVALEALQQLPALLTSMGEDSTTTTHIQALDVKMKEMTSTATYTYTATIVIPKSDVSPADDSFEYLSFLLPDLNASDPGYEELKTKIDALKQALEQAGPPRLFVEVTLPGEITTATRNGQADGRLAGGHVQWTLLTDQPGTYLLQAVSQANTPAAGDWHLIDTFRNRERIKQFDQVVEPGRDDLYQAAAKAREAVQGMRRQLGQDPDATNMTSKEWILAEATYLSYYCDSNNQGKKICLMPRVWRALPLIKRLAATPGDDDKIVAALASLVDQLINHDMVHLAARTAAFNQMQPNK
jgi:hypothetical protein